MLSSDMRTIYRGRMLDRIRSGKYPSGQLLDRIERSLTTTDEAVDYIDALMEKVENEYPSLHLLDRIDRVIALVEQAERRSAARAELTT